MYNERYFEWRDGRVVECTGLENQQGFIALPGFESPFLRHLMPFNSKGVQIK
jgi:hypothetical protein